MICEVGPITERGRGPRDLQGGGCTATQCHIEGNRWNCGDDIGSIQMTLTILVGDKMEQNLIIHSYINIIRIHRLHYIRYVTRKTYLFRGHAA